MEKYICEVLVRKDKNGKIVSFGGNLISEPIIVSANSETFAKQVACNQYAKMHQVSTFSVSIGKVRKM